MRAPRSCYPCHQVRRLAKWVKTQDPRPCGHVDVVIEGCDSAAPDDVAADEKVTSFHCAACNKWYKNAQQLSNHEQSSKHKQMVAKVRKQLLEDDELKQLEELAMEDDEPDENESAASTRTESRGGRGKGKKKGRRDGVTMEDVDEDVAGTDSQDAAIEAAVMSAALPSPADVALQAQQTFQNSDEYKKLNKTQRRKAMQQWESENEHLMELLRKDDTEPKPEAPPPKEKKPEGPVKKEKVHGSGAHSREIKTPKKKKAVYGKPRGQQDELDVD